MRGVAGTVPGPEFSTSMSRTVPSHELLRQQSYAIKNQLGHPQPPTIGVYFACSSLVLYDIRAPIIGLAWRPTILMP